MVSNGVEMRPYAAGLMLTGLAPLIPAAANASSPSVAVANSRLDKSALIFLDSCLSGKIDEPQKLAAFGQPLRQVPKDLPRSNIVARKLDQAGKLVVYANKGGPVIACGMAFYGAASIHLRKEVLKRVEADTRLNRQPVKQTPALETRAFRHSRYWGDPHAPTMFGVFVLNDPVNPAARALPSITTRRSSGNWHEQVMSAFHPKQTFA